jgi:hypothetical protein
VATGAPGDDLLGLTRPADGDLDGTGLPDIGAYENPAELTRLRWTSETALAWDGSDSASMVFDLFRDLVSGLAPGPVGLCEQAGLASPAASQTAAPPAGEGWFYLVRGRDASEGTLGFDSEGAGRLPGESCP